MVINGLLQIIVAVADNIEESILLQDTKNGRCNIKKKSVLQHATVNATVFWNQKSMKSTFITLVAPCCSFY